MGGGKDGYIEITTINEATEIVSLGDLEDGEGTLLLREWKDVVFSTADEADEVRHH